MPDVLHTPHTRVAHVQSMDTQIQWWGPVLGALLAHAVLIVALTMGLNWPRTETPVVFEAELWSAVPETAAPAPVPQAEPDPIPEPEPEPTPEPQPAPPPPEPAPAPPAPAPDLTPQPSAADIALQQQKEQEAADQAEQKRLALAAEKERLIQERLAAQAAEKKAQAAKERAAQEKAAAEKAAKEKAAREKAAREKAAAEKAAKEKAAQEKAAAEKAAKEKAAKEKAAREKAERERVAREKAKEEARQAAITQQIRQEQMARTAGLLGASGTGTGSSQGSANAARGPSASYGAKLTAAVRPNIFFTGSVVGNPAAVVEITADPSGKVLGRRLVESSGNTAWDEAVLRAVDRTARFPLDENGRVPSPLQIKFRPKD